jgi:hypothetical protein
MIGKMARRAAGRANCSPALIVLGMLVVVAAVCYVYRQVIIDTLLTVLIAAGCVAGIVIAVAVTLNGVKWHRRKALEHASALAALPEPDLTGTPFGPEVTVMDVKRIGAEADWLAAEGSELAFTDDGKLVVKNGAEK